MVERRLRGKEQQERRILTAAGRLFWKKGYLGTSIDEIAKGADVNKATIYYYFKDKASILNELISIPLKELINQALPIAQMNLMPDKKLEALVASHIAWQASHPGIAGIGHVERKNLPAHAYRRYIRMRDDYEEIIRKTIEDGVRQGAFNCKEVRLATMFALGLVNSIMQWFSPRGRLTADEIAKQACRFILKALKG